MKAKFESIFVSLIVSFNISFTVFGVVIFLLAFLAPARGAASTSAPTDASAAGRQAAASEVPRRQALAGTWKFNRERSDDPMKKLVSDDSVPLGDGGLGVQPVGQLGGRPDTYSQSGSNMGTPTPNVFGGAGAGAGAGGGGLPMPQTASAHRWETDKDRQKRLEPLLPASSLAVEEKDGEFDFTDDQSRKQVFYTDGRKLRKSKDDKLQEFAAHWEAGHLSYDEKRPPHGTVTRTFELSSDGRQMTESIEIDNGSISIPVVLKYVYDAAAPTAAQR